MGRSWSGTSRAYPGGERSRVLLALSPKWYHHGMKNELATSRADAIPRTIRFPLKVRQKVVADASRCGRSFEAQVIAILRHHYGEDVDLAPVPDEILALARASLSDMTPAERRLVTRRLRESNSR